MPSKAERFADPETGLLRWREAVRDVSTPLALLTTFNMTEKA
jgi:hypothetical protein